MLSNKWHKLPCSDKQQAFVEAIAAQLFSRSIHKHYTRYEAKYFITKFRGRFEKQYGNTRPRSWRRGKLHNDYGAIVHNDSHLNPNW